ncbi:MAG: hypothetical protein P8J27_12205, partial [Mariniblastus sp.]|nr:hypothetical protein [Mariniblastus sp.]
MEMQSLGQIKSYGSFAVAFFLRELTICLPLGSSPEGSDIPTAMIGIRHPFANHRCVLHFRNLGPLEMLSQSSSRGSNYFSSTSIRFGDGKTC